MIIRPVEPRDLPALRELFRVSRHAAFHWETPSSYDLGDFDRETEGELQIVAIDGAEPLGFISVWEPDNFIHHLHVDPRQSRRGIGRALLSALPGWKVTRYRLKCVSANEAALAFYRSQGFIRVGEGQADGQDYLLLESTAE
ncbi:GNAT family N-acetyltransferase [Rhizobium sp. S95]|uniref:GNAT family N-acetyltransferase n=1 Tax=Ciceribacter sichuanensis TaxID=2949647 RepID=A0AAJ1BWQ6_9HYPH|nr:MULTISPECIES: GNAT family N-acetyltransferase [unclassified Ciceribacter]MCM2396165.1 GNAT family N-acetyltransferase [Ciceribacter sp. S95]MCO5957684.1 GNAT family N-acetyltransferase [Ciceribacter sp. S101]